MLTRRSIKGGAAAPARAPLSSERLPTHLVAASSDGIGIGSRVDAGRAAPVPSRDGNPRIFPEFQDLHSLTEVGRHANKFSPVKPLRSREQLCMRAVNPRNAGVDVGEWVSMLPVVTDPIPEPDAAAVSGVRPVTEQDAAGGPHAPSHQLPEIPHVHSAVQDPLPAQEGVALHTWNPRRAGIAAAVVAVVLCSAALLLPVMPVSAAPVQPALQAATGVLAGTGAAAAGLLAVPIAAAQKLRVLPPRLHGRYSTGRVSATATAEAATAPAGGVPPTSGLAGVKVLCVAGSGSSSPYGAPWSEVAQHTAQRLAWMELGCEMVVVNEAELAGPTGAVVLDQALAARPAFVMGLAVQSEAAVNVLVQAAQRMPTRVFTDSDMRLQQLSAIDGLQVEQPGLLQRLSARLPWTRAAQAAQVAALLPELWSRHTSDDLLFTFLVLLDSYVAPVAAVRSRAQGIDLPSLQCMITNCADQIFACVSNPTCKAGLDCLNACAFNDQVCQYRCIVSHESPLFEQFALCVLQLHNCRGLSAVAPRLPDPAPMASWNGEPMTHELAERLYTGWLDDGRPYSWLIASGKNPAYDYFPCQHQIFYQGKGKGVMWYEPVFKVRTLDGREVWRRRKYRCRRGAVPGTHHLSVLDNGVTSNEFWRILDCAEDLSFCLFYYSGAASAAGLSYSGAVLGTADGRWPVGADERIHSALERAGIKPWELSTADNSACSNAPLFLTAERRGA